MILSDQELNRYSRHLSLDEIGVSGQEKLKKSRVLVVGAGGLGCPILQYLTAAGIGTLGIIDFDLVDETNLQRQVLFGYSSIGENKALAAKKRLIDLNPFILINAYSEKLTPLNALKLFADYDIIIDGTDNFSSRYLINDASVILDKPVIYGSIHKFEGQVSVFNYNGGPTYRCLFPVLPKPDSIPNCSQIGVVGVLPGIIGSFQANEAIKIILGIGMVLSGKLLLLNSLNNSTSIIEFSRSEQQIKKVLKIKGRFEEQIYELKCKIDDNEISAKQLLSRINLDEKFQFIDLREDHEKPKITEFDVLNISMTSIDSKIELIKKDRTVILFCQSGIRSKKAVGRLKDEFGLKNLISLKGGVVSWFENKKDDIKTKTESICS